jgi:RNA-directed DNA polymerase
MTGYSFSTPPVAMGTLNVNGPEDKAPDWDASDWDVIDWRAHEGRVRRLRRRIFKATQEQDWAKLRSLQKMMLRSWSNTLVSVRQVTQRNAGRTTAGVDGEIALTPARRMEVAVCVHQTISSWQPPAGQAGVHTEGQWKTAPTRHSRDHGPVPSGAGA